MAIMTDEVSARELTGVQKAALVLINMTTERAAAVLRNLADDEAVEIAQEMARLRSTTGRVAERTIREFNEQVEGHKASGGALSGKNAAATLIQATYEPDRAAEMLERLEQSQTSASFAFLDSIEPAETVKALQLDVSETIAFVLVQLSPALAAKILMLLEPARRLDVAEAIATMGTPTPEAGSIVAGALRSKLRSLSAKSDTAPPEEEDPSAPPPRKVQPLVDIMNAAEPAAEGELIAGLWGRDEDLAAEVRAKLLSFEDVPRLQDRDLQQVLRGLDISQIALALKGADPAIADAMKSNMSERNRETLAEETAELGRVPKSRVEEARNAVVRSIRELANAQGLELKKPPAEPGAETEEPEVEPEPEEEYVD